MNVGFERPLIAAGRLPWFSFGSWGDETGLCLPFCVVILDGRHLALLLRLLLLLLGKTGVHKVGSETGVVNPFALLRGNDLSLSMLGSKFRLHNALLRLRAGAHGTP